MADYNFDLAMFLKRVSWWLNFRNNIDLKEVRVIGFETNTQNSDVNICPRFPQMDKIDGPKCLDELADLE